MAAKCVTKKTFRPRTKEYDCEGSRLQNGGLTLLLISLSADSTTVLLKAKIGNYSLMNQDKTHVRKEADAFVDGSKTREGRTICYLSNQSSARESEHDPTRRVRI